MKIQKILFVPAFLLCTIHSIATEFIPTPEDVNEVARRLIGTFDSSQQAAENPSYVVVKLQSCPAMVEPENLYLYVEQTATQFSNKPYRQRIYKISINSHESSIESRIFRVKTQDSLVGVCDQNRRPMVALEDLVDIQCAVQLKRQGLFYTGSTPEEGCENNFGGLLCELFLIRCSAQNLCTRQNWLLFAVTGRGPSKSS